MPARDRKIPSPAVLVKHCYSLAGFPELTKLLAGFHDHESVKILLHYEFTACRSFAIRIEYYHVNTCGQIIC